MIKWTIFPFVRFALLFISGILFAIYEPDLIDREVIRFYFIACSALYLVLTGLIQWKIMPYVNVGVFASASLFAFGFLHVKNKTEIESNNHLIHFQNVKSYSITINSLVDEKESSWKMVGEVQAVKGDSGWIKACGKVQLYFSRDEFEKPFQYGDALIIHGTPQLLRDPENPGEFDYKRFLSFKNIYHQHFIRDVNAVLHYYNEPPSQIFYYASLAREWAKQTLFKYVGGDQQRAIVSALVLGIKDGLDNELVNAYSSTGAMHVLAVSGLHVGIVYMFILILLKPLERYTWGKWMIAFTCVGFLWMYAFVTGLSPSVLRAVTMFTFVAFSKPLNRSTNIYNSMGAAAFCLLIYDPYLIMSVGFQLSFLAVIGIVFLQGKLYNLWTPRFWLIDKVWQISCVSIAAQIATFSLGLLYFHQFPVYFLVSNLIVIPAAFLILLGGILILVTSPLGFVAGILGLIVEWIIKVLNYGVFTVESWPFSLISDVYITTIQCWIVIIGIVLAVMFLERRRFSLYIVIFILIVMYSLIQWQRFDSSISVDELIVYKVNGHQAIDMISQGRCYFITDSTLMNDHERIKFHIHPNRLKRGVQTVSFVENEDQNKLQSCKFIHWNDFNVAIINSKNVDLRNLKADILIIGNNAVADFTQLSTKRIILDSSNTHAFVNKVLEEKDKYSFEVHSVLHHGVYSITF